MIYELIIFFISFLLILLLGKGYDKFLLKSYFSSNNFTIIESLTIKLIIGLLLLISSIASFYTSFTSSYVVFFLSLIITPIFYIKKIPLKNNIEKNSHFEKYSFKYLLIFIIFILFFIYHQYLYIFSSSTPFYDFLFLSKISSGLINNGVESFYSASSSYYGVDVKPHLYHYFDLWFTGFFSKIFNYSEYKVLLYVCFPLFHLLIFLLLFIICEHIFKNFYIGIFTSLGLLFGNMVVINYDNSFFQLVETYRGLPYSLFFKLTIIYILLLTSYFFYLKKLLNISVVILCALMIIYPTTVPTFFALSIVVLFFSLIVYRKVSLLSICILVTIFYLIIFQKLFKYETITNITFHLYSLKQYFILYVESFIKIFIEHYLVVILLILNLFKSARKLLINEVFLMVFICLLGAISYVYFNPPGIRDLNQIITNISPVLILVLTVELIRGHDSKKIFKVFVSISLIVGFYNIYLNYTNPNVKLLGEEIKHSFKFRNKIEEFVLRNNSDYCSISAIQPSDYYYHTSMKFNYLLMMKEFKTPLEIKVLFDEKDKLSFYSKKNINYPPNQYFSNHSNSVELIYNYLKKNNFKYILLEKKAVANNEKITTFLNRKCSKIMEDKITKDAIFQLN